MRKLLLLTALVTLVFGVFGAAQASAARPQTAIHEGPTGSTTSHSARFHLYASKGGLPCRGCKIRCKLDARPWRLCLSKGSGYKTFRNLSKGRHTLRAQAVDAAGRRDLTPAIRRWRVI